MKLIKVIYLFFLATCVCSCNIMELFPANDSHSCEELLDFKLNETIKFKSNQNILEFKVIDLYVKKVEGKDGKTSEFCQISQGYETNINQGYKIKERTSQGSNYMDEEDAYIEISLLEAPLEGDFFKVKQISDVNYHTNDLNVDYYFKYELNNKIYDKVIVISKDTINANPKIGFIKRAIPGGIIEFYDFQSKQTWKLVE